MRSTTRLLTECLGCLVMGASVAAQGPPRNHADSAPTFGVFAVGVGSIKSDYLSQVDASGQPGSRNWLGGVTGSARGYYRPPSFPQRVHLGFEFGAVMVSPGEASGLVWVTKAGEELGPVMNADDVGFHGNALGSVRLLSFGPVSIRGEVGAGAMFFPESHPDFEGVVLARFAPHIRISPGGMLGPYVSAMRTLGQTKTSSVQAGIGLWFCSCSP